MAIRTARFQDARQIAEVHVDSWRAAYRGIVPDSLLEGLSVGGVGGTVAGTTFSGRRND